MRRDRTCPAARPTARRRLLRFLGRGCAVLAIVSCDRHRIPASPVPPDGAPTDALQAASPEAGKRLIGVRVSGAVALGGLPPGRAIVVLTDGPCFELGSHFIGVAPVSQERTFALDVYPPLGTRLDVCGALIVSGQRLTRYHGRAARAPLLATGTGSLRFDGVDVTIAKGPPLRVPDGLRLE